jgi:hypothetical protein
MSQLRDAIQSGIKNSDRQRPSIAPFWQYRDSLYVTEGVVMYEDRVVIPPALRQEVLESLHAAHQGVSSMELRARAIVLWPGMTADIIAYEQFVPFATRTLPPRPRCPPLQQTRHLLHLRKFLLTSTS